MELLTANQVAEMLQCSPKNVYKLAHSGELPAYKVGRLLRFKPADVEKLAKPLKIYRATTD